MSQRQKRNLGYTLVEVITVIAIMAVLAGAGISMMGLIPRNQVRKCAKNIISLVEKTRTEAMSFQNARVTIYKKTDGVYADIYVTKQGTESLYSTTKLGDADLKVEFEIEADDGSGSCTTYIMGLDASAGQVEKLTIHIDRSSGSFKNSTLEPAGAVTGTCKTIRISKGSAESTLKLVKLTGKIGY